MRFGGWLSEQELDGLDRFRAVMILRILVLLVVGMGLVQGADRPPNVVIFLMDDLGYSDIGCFGSKDIRTPNMDKMAAEGMRLTDFYVAQAVCSASRAALMTGCYANRVNMQGALNHTSQSGLAVEEVLLPEVCKSRGYATAIFGKWHLGTTEKFHPMKQGFDEYLGIPYSNDNSKYHPSLASVMPPLPLYDGEKVVELDPDQSQFTRRFTERAVGFIEKNKDQPFFLYVPQVMPHVPIFASERFKDRSGKGLYVDVVEELDWSVGEIFAALKRAGVDDNTMVLLFSDNGPFLSYGTHAGHAQPFREGKLTTFEGGVRVPCIARWPGKIPAGKVCTEPVAEFDLLPTITKLIGAELPKAKLDGADIAPILRGENAAHSPHEALFFYAGEDLEAVRSGKWKLHFAHSYISVDGEPGRDGKPANFANMKPKSITQSGIQGIASRHGYRVEKIELSLFDLDADLGESHNLAAEHPEVVERLSKLAEPVRLALGDGLQGMKGAEVRGGP